MKQNNRVLAIYKWALETSSIILLGIKGLAN